MTEQGVIILNEEGRVRVCRRKNFFTRRVVKHWPRFPGEMVDALFLETLSVWLNWLLSNLC